MLYSSFFLSFFLCNWVTTNYDGQLPHHHHSTHVLTPPTKLLLKNEETPQKLHLCLSAFQPLCPNALLPSWLSAFLPFCHCQPDTGIYPPTYEAHHDGDDMLGTSVFIQVLYNGVVASHLNTQSNLDFNRHFYMHLNRHCLKNIRNHS